MMNSYDFTLVIDHEPTEAELDSFPAAGLDDTAIESGPNTATLVHCDREADTLTAAVLEAVRQLESLSIQPIAVHAEDLVSLRDIAHRMGRSYESVRLIAHGKRGPGGFPSPMDTGEGWALYSWAQVSRWFAEHYGTASIKYTGYDEQLAIIDHVIRARAMLKTAPAGMADLLADGLKVA